MKSINLFNGLLLLTGVISFEAATTAAKTLLPPGMDLPPAIAFLDGVVQQTAGILGTGVTSIAHAAEPTAMVDPNSFSRIDERPFELHAEPWVSVVPLSRSVVRKVEHGRVTDVVISTTSTGVYSTDVVRSGHVRYPGLEAVPRRDTPQDAAILDASGEWRSLPTSAGSVVRLATAQNPRVVLADASRS